MPSQFFLGPPGVGKTTLQQTDPGRFIDIEESIDWKRAAGNHSLYLEKRRRHDTTHKLEHELDWTAVWMEEVIPRLRTALLIEKDVVMGLIAPSNIEMVSRFLEPLRQQTTLILPDEQQHFSQVHGQVERRPRVWDSRLMGWQNTFWIRLLLQGLAAQLHLKTVKQPHLEPKRYTQRRGLAAREAVSEEGKTFVEYFFGRWIELDEHEQIVALHRQVIANHYGVLLECERTAKVCSRGEHDCGKETLLQRDIHRHPLTSWIAQDKLRPIITPTKLAVIFFAGTLAPFHHGHLEALDAAKAHLEKEGWHVLGGYASAFRQIKEDRVDQLYTILGPAECRTTMLQLGTMSSDWLMADEALNGVLDLPALKEGRHPTQRIAHRLREQDAINKGAQVTTFWVNGKDAYIKPEFYEGFAAHADTDPLNPLRMLIVDNRPGDNIWSEKALRTTVPSLIPYVNHCKVKAPSPSSATAIRKALMEADRNALRTLVGLPMVEAYLMGLMHIHQHELST